MSQFGPVAGGVFFNGGPVAKMLAESVGDGFTELDGGKAAELLGEVAAPFAGDNQGLERSMQEAMRRALGELRAEEFGAWFRDWDLFLAEAPTQAIFSGSLEPDAELLEYDDDEFRAYWWNGMEPALLRWRDAAIDGKLPDGLRRLLRSRLPELLPAAHEAVLGGEPSIAAPNVTEIQAILTPRVVLNALWTIPRPTQNFQERPELIAQIDAALERRPATALTALHGLGGIGKTQMARRYADLRRDRYAAGVWIASEGRPAILTSFAELVPMLGVSVQKEQEATAELAMAALCERQPWLVVFDNAVTVEDVRPFVERLNGRGHVLITSRDERWDGVADAVSVTQWSVEESVKFLLTRTGQTDRASAETLARELDGLVLALDHAAASMRSGEVSLSVYLRNWRERLRKTPGGHEYEKSVAATLGLSLDAVQLESAAAYELLCLFAWLAPDQIPRKELLEAGAKEFPEGLARTWEDPDEWSAAIETLARYSLVRRQRVDGLTVGYAVHRVVQQMMRERMGSEGERWFGVVCDVVGQAMPIESREPPNWGTMEALLPHARSIRSFADEFDSPGSLGRLLNEAAVYLRIRGLFGEARDFVQLALELGLGQFGPDHPEVALRRSNLATILRRLGELHEARKEIDMALESDLRQFGPDHPNIAVRRSNLANILRDLGEYQEARKQIELALESDLRQFGPDHSNVANDRSNLAIVLGDLGEHQEARKQIELALESSLRQLGPDHPNVADHRSNLAHILGALKEHQEARKQIELALGSDLRQFGPDHPNVAIRRTNLAAVLNVVGDFHGGLQEIEQAIDIFRRKLPEGHPHIRTAEESRQTILRAIASQSNPTA
jgi:tetratricopeptide (TPR) repeat protein